MPIYFAVLLILSTLVSVANASPAQEYDRLYEEYSCAKTTADWQTILGKLERFAERNDAGLYRANAYYWIGERHYDRRDYSLALAAFEKASTIPGSYKERDARIKVIYCYLKLELFTTAKWEIDRFEREFTGEAEVKMAKNMRKALK